MSENEWTVLRRDLITPFTCGYMWAGMLGGAVGGLFLLGLIEHFLSR